MKTRGDYIGGNFVIADGELMRSVNPATRETVLETPWDPKHIDAACAAAADAFPAWSAMGLEARYETLLRFRDAIVRRKEDLADAIVCEVGKIRSEARTEVNALISRFALVKSQIDKDFKEGPLPGFPGESQRFRPHGVVGVIGPYNFPLHLCHAHAVPALLMGNSVVIKPSEVAPRCGQIYAEAADEAGLPAGVFNMVNGLGAAGAALTANPHVRGICFTGSYPTGRRIVEATLDRPEVLVALEMGGKNTAIVLPDADLRQAAHEITVGGYLTSGQRCTCTDRVLVHADVKDALIDALRETVGAIHFGDPDDEGVFAGPIVNAREFERYDKVIRDAEAQGAVAILPHEPFGPGYFATPSLHDCGHVSQTFPGYTDDEVFGPNLSIQSFDTLDEAIGALNRSDFGFANAVFTRDGEAFERLYAEAYAGIWNMNRTTNQASPRLPFGGVGKSGNFRPAGAYATRNVCYPVAMQNRVIGNVTPHPMLRGKLPAPDLEQLEATHQREEREELDRDLLETPRPIAVLLPPGGELPESQAWLERFYAGGRFAREKKPTVYDHFRSHGPFFVSIDEEPIAVLDGMSQTATLPGGFNDHAVVSGFLDGAFGDTHLRSVDTSHAGHPAADALATTLKQLVPGYDHVTFANSGAEANEKALALCRANAPEKATKVVAFEGAFHGRTLLSLHATYNPKKRAPFEFAGYACDFAPFPVWDTPMDEEPDAPEDYYPTLADFGVREADRIYRGQDPLLDREIDTLLAVDRMLDSGEVFAVIVEPMQSEGGDRYATSRFFIALRLLTRRRDVALVMDEVQCGFGLGGPFAWHTRFGMLDVSGPDGPDAVVFAKRAQTGIVMSRFPDPEPTPVHTASLVRGRLHAQAIADNLSYASEVQAMVWERLTRIADAYPHLVSRPRARGYAFAFDLPSAASLPRYIGQRFWRGAIVYAAGKQTVRYRLNSSYTGHNIERLFEAIRRSLSWLDAHPKGAAPTWLDDGGSHGRYRSLSHPAPGYRVREIHGRDDALLKHIIKVESEVYEPARRDSPEKLRPAFEKDGVVLVAEVLERGQWVIAGTALACAIEKVRGMEGPNEDPLTGRDNALYSLAITIDDAHRGMGLGGALKYHQVKAARAKTRPDGSPRYTHITGRNRIGNSDTMSRLNERLGAHTMGVYEGRYGVMGAKSRYYRMPTLELRPLDLEVPTLDAGDVAQGVCCPLAEVPTELMDLADKGGLNGPTTTKITICNFITPAIVRATEWIGALTPDLAHMYLTSSRDETFDKTVRLLKYHRGGAKVVVGLEGGYVGHTTAAARSLSDPAVHRQGPGHFDWPRLPHPAEAGTQATIDALRNVIREHGSSKVAGLFIEPVQERTGRVIPADFWPALEAVRQDRGIPVVLVESATGAYRSGAGAFASSGIDFLPDVLTWWGGGQTGYVHVSTELFVNTPLTFVSTWDGDELSLVRAHHQLRAIRQLDLAHAVAALDAVAETYGAVGVPSHGQGLYRVFFPVDGEALDAAWERAGLHSRTFPNGGRVFAPYLDRAEEAIAKLAAALETLAQG